MLVFLFNTFQLKIYLQSHPTLSKKGDQPILITKFIEAYFLHGYHRRMAKMVEKIHEKFKKKKKKES